MKKVCVLVFILCLLCTAALATELPPRQEYIYGDYTYTLTEDGTAKITSYSGTEPEVVIPAKVDGHPVTAIGDGAFRCCGTRTGVDIPNCVTFVGANPFAECSRLQSISFSKMHPTLEVVEGALFHSPFAARGAEGSQANGAKVVQKAAIGEFLGDLNGTAALRAAAPFCCCCGKD